MENRKVAVQSRNGGCLFYQIPDERIFRQFTNGETKQIDLDELKKLQFAEGGDYILRNCLIIKDEEALKELNMSVEPEYFYTEKEILNILEKGTMDQFEDMLNFAPAGVIDIIQQLAVRIELPDTRKRKMLFEKTNFNVDAAININHIVEEDNKTEEKEEVKKVERKAAAPTNGRKAEAPKYIILGEGKES